MKQETRATKGRRHMVQLAPYLRHPSLRISTTFNPNWSPPSGKEKALWSYEVDLTCTVLDNVSITMAFRAFVRSPSRASQFLRTAFDTDPASPIQKYSRRRCADSIRVARIAGKRLLHFFADSPDGLTTPEDREDGGGFARCILLFSLQVCCGDRCLVKSFQKGDCSSETLGSNP